MYSFHPEVLRSNSVLPKTDYHSKIEILKSTLDLDFMFSFPALWLCNRDSLHARNSDFSQMTGTAVPSEMAEVDEEHAKLDTVDFDRHALETEIGDMFFSTFMTAFASGFSVDASATISRVNGVGGSSGIHELLLETVQNSRFETFPLDLQQLLSYEIAYMAGLPGDLPDLHRIIPEVYQKNCDNYPQEFFNGLNPETNQPLNKDQKKLQELHSINSLKLIRYVLRKILRLADRDYGLQMNDWQPYRWLIRDFKHADVNLSQLAARLILDQKLTPEQATRVWNQVPKLKKANNNS